MRLDKIEKPTCLGDIIHNRNLEILTHDVGMDRYFFQELFPIILNDLDKCQHNWLFNRFPESYCKRLNYAMKSKNNKQFTERLNSFLYHCIMKHSPYHYMIYKELAHNIDKLIQKFEN